MKKYLMYLWAIGLAASIAGCTPPISKTAEQELKQPVNCATAEEDVATLEAEKASVEKQILMGVTAVAPAGAVLGILTGTEDEKIEVAIGEYDRQIEQKIREIKQTCGLA